MGANQTDYSLYLVTDRTLSRGRSTLEVVTAAIQGGVTCVQLREKACSTREFMDEALALKSVLLRYGIPLLINDRVDIALAVNADGVHLGQSDMRIADARRILRPTMIVGISVESVADAIQAEAEGADYIGISPVFATGTKTDTAPPLGLEGVRRIREQVKIPLVGIGGIHAGNAAEVVRHGADGIAVVSAIVSAENPTLAAAELRRLAVDLKPN
ncbi:thiamine phosphate synthase [bacterium]|nr:thiamine phosphate synthase [bacterium]